MRAIVRTFVGPLVIVAALLTLMKQSSALWSWGTSLAFGNDTIAGFDPTQDAIRLSLTHVNSFAGVQADMTSAGGGTVITFDASHSITLNGVASVGLAAANFRFV